MFDVIIIGAGPAGVSASLYVKRANLKTGLIYNSNSTSLEKAHKIENYYGFENGIKGKDLYEVGIKQAKNLGVEILDEEVLEIEKKEKTFIIKTTKKELEAKAVILATGNKKEAPKIKGIKEYEGKGISYCAICDGFFYKGKDVAVLGNGNYAINETMDLINIAKKITIVTNGEKAPEIREENVNVNSKKIKEISGKDKVEKIEFEDNSKIDVSAVFVAEGVAGSTDFAKKIGAFVNNKNIIVDDKMQTNVEGLFACGDCIGGILQVSKAVYDGTKAGLSAIEFVRQLI